MNSEAKKSRRVSATPITQLRLEIRELPEILVIELASGPLIEPVTFRRHRIPIERTRPQRAHVWTRDIQHVAPRKLVGHSYSFGGRSKQPVNGAQYRRRNLHRGRVLSGRHQTSLFD